MGQLPLLDQAAAVLVSQQRLICVPGHRLAFHTANAEEDTGCDERDQGEDDDDKHAVDDDGEGTLPEAGEFDAVEFLEPLGLASGECAHAESVAANRAARAKMPRAAFSERCR